MPETNPDNLIPATYSASGFFCPACDARIGFANVCDCGASSFNGWHTPAVEQTPAVAAMLAVEQVLSTVLDRANQTSTTDAEVEAIRPVAARILALAERLS